ncbi:MAG TPA: hypothetical protein VM261_13660 [Kofleriaceae bacterium]|nr:hypothetical protein [Kofleriaceae bacterium]
MARCLDGSGNRVDGIDAVELGFLFRMPDVSEPKIVSERDLHLMNVLMF